MPKYIRLSDPDHSWYSVKRAELIYLGIESDISNYSYQRGATVYLEEDCDWPKFFLAYWARYGVGIAVGRSHTDKRSPIRSYEFFRPTGKKS